MHRAPGVVPIPLCLMFIWHLFVLESFRSSIISVAGAGGAGFDSSTSKGGDGGPGKLSNISGNDLYWAAGGGGALYSGCQTCQGVS